MKKINTQTNIQSSSLTTKNNQEKKGKNDLKKKEKVEVDANENANSFSSLIDIKTKQKLSTSKKTKKNKGLDFNEVNNSLKNCISHIQYVNNEEEKSLSIILENIRLVSLNEIFATFQTRPFELFKYKKHCHQLIDKILKPYLNVLPTFKESDKIRLIYFRQASRYFDHDSLIPSFKFFLDALVENGVIGDDNPNIIEDIKPIQQIKKGQVKSLLGIKIEKIKDLNLQNSNINIFKEWNFVREIEKDEIFEEL